MKNLNKLLEILDKKTLRKLVILVPFLIFVSFIEVLSIALVLPVISLTINPNQSDLFLNSEINNILNINNSNELLIALILVLLSVFILKYFFLTFYYYFQNKVAFDVMHETTNKLYKSYLNKNFKFHLNNNSTHIISNLSTQLPDMVYNFVQPLLILISEIFVISSIFIIVFFFDYKTAFLFILIAMTGFVFFKLLSSKIKKWGEKRIIYEKLKVQNIQQSILSIKETIIHDRKNYFLNKVKNYSNFHRILLTKYFTLLEIPKMIFEFIALFSILLFLSYSIFVLKIIDTEIMPIIGTFCMAAYRIMPAANKILVSLQRIKFSTNSLENLYRVFKDQKNDQIQINNIEKKFINNFNILRLSKINFSYNNNDLVLKDINLEINAGEAIGVVGKSGSGKSSLINLLLGLLKPTSGKIEINNIELEKCLRSWQKLLGYVPQNINLVDGSIKENILLGQKDNKQMINEAIKLANLENLINDSDGGINTQVGENGIKISGGQKQRLGIARALYGGRKILFFDEATSALDEETEKKIMKNIYSLRKIKTLIIVTHNKELLKNCDKIYKIENKNLIKISI